MGFKEKLLGACQKNSSLLCVGLDPVLSKLPEQVKSDEHPIYQFNKAIIDATCDLVCAYKPNSAFYEAEGPEGIEQLKLTADYIHKNYPDIPIILDAKRADIGNTNNGYVRFIFDYLGMDAVTLHPYLGKEALEPFLARRDKGLIILCRTSNPGAAEFQDLETNSRPLYEQVAINVSENWNSNQNCLLVVGATYPEEMKKIRKIIGDDIVFLVPGIGTQGGDIGSVIEAGLSTDTGNPNLIISSSRQIIYASAGNDFAVAARSQAKQMRNAINRYRQRKVSSK